MKQQCLVHKTHPFQNVYFCVWDAIVLTEHLTFFQSTIANIKLQVRFDGVGLELAEIDEDLFGNRQSDETVRPETQLKVIEWKSRGVVLQKAGRENMFADFSSRRIPKVFVNEIWLDGETEEK